MSWRHPYLCATWRNPAPKPHLLWDARHPAAIITDFLGTEVLWSPRGRTCVAELEAMTDPAARGWAGAEIERGIRYLVKKKGCTFEDGVLTYPKIYRPGRSGALSRMRPKKGKQ